MKPVLPLLAAALLLASGFLRAEEAAADPHAEADEAEATSKKNLPAIDLTPALLYRFLAAEIAGQRGMVAESAEVLLQMALETRDPRIARRATEVALHGRRSDLAIIGARLWLELDADSPSHARQTLIGLLASQGMFADLTQELAILLAAEPDNLQQNLMRLGRFFSRSNDRQMARELIGRVTEPYIKHPEAHFARAQAAYEMRDMTGARAEIERALALKPDWETAVVLLAQLTEDRGEAIDILARFVRANPGASEVRLTYARTLVAEKRYDEARQQFRRLLERGGEGSGDVVFAVAMLSLQLNDTADAERHLKQLVEIGHAEADKARYYLGQITEEGKRWAEAEQWFSQVGHGEHYLAARMHAASAMAKQGRIDDARRHLVASDAASPRERAQLIIGEAQILREAGRLDDAYAVLADGLTRQPEQPEMLYEIALLAERMGRPEELERRLVRLIEIKPDHAHAHNALGYSFADRNIRLDEAHRLIDRALELAPNDPFILDSKGWILFRLGNNQAALDALNQAFGIRADPEIAAHLGEVLWVLGRQTEARSTWEKARAAHPGNEVLAETIKRFLP